MIFEDAQNYSHEFEMTDREAPDHEILLSQLKKMAINQEAKVYALFSSNWKAQLDPQLRTWMLDVRQKSLETQTCNQKQKDVLNQQFETLSTDNQTAEVQLDDYFQL